MKAKDVALSGIIAAFIAICLTIGAYFQTFDLTGLLLASLFVTVPLCKKKYLAAVLAVLVGAVVGFIFSGFNILAVVFPAFLFYFGPAPIVIIYLNEKQLDNNIESNTEYFSNNKPVYSSKVKAVLFFVLRLIWCVSCCIGILLFYLLVLGTGIDFFGTVIDLSSGGKMIFVLFLTVVLIGVIIFFLFEKLLTLFCRVLDRYIGKFIK